MGQEELIQYSEFLAKSDITKWDMADQVKVLESQLNMIESIKPILLKYMTKETEIPSFLLKL